MTSETSGAEGTFQLEVEISGLCLFLWGEDGRVVDLVMPDARDNRPDKPDEVPKDDPKPHVGYLRFDLRNVDGAPTLPPGDRLETPRYEVVHRFNREALHLDVGDEENPMKKEDLKIPDFSEFAPTLEPVDGAREGKAPEVLMRTSLRGGSFRTITDGVQWKIPGDLHPKGEETVREIGGEVYWTRTVKGDALQLRLVPLDGGESVALRLRPSEQGGKRWLRLKIANLCDNALEWEELTTPAVAGPDADFRWLYRLMRRSGDLGSQSLDAYPVPTPPKNIPQEGMLQACFSAQVTRSS
jgi:hypothetical protein